MNQQRLLGLVEYFASSRMARNVLPNRLPHMATLNRAGDLAIEFCGTLNGN